MSDRLKAFLRYSFLRWKDMGDGTVAPVVSSSSVIMLEAGNGELFPRDCETTYDYDTSGTRIISITKHTVDGRTFVQTWEWDGEALVYSSPWVKQ